MDVDLNDMWAIHEPAFVRISEWLSQPPQSRLIAANGGKATAQAPYDFIEPGIALISVSGVLGKSLPWWQDSGATLTDLSRAIRAAANDPTVDAILLAVDSPGGTVAGTTDVAEAVAAAKAKKPVCTYASDLMASAAYWIGAQADRVYAANALTSIGSIGVYGGVIWDTSKAADKAGIKTYVIKAGENKSVGEFGQEVTPQQVAQAQARVDQIHAHFKAAVQAGRKMSAGQVAQVSDGRVFLAADALRAGLIDGVKTLDEAVGELVALAATRKQQMEHMRMTATQTEPKAATLAELKANCPGAPSDWILAQMEAGATVQAAQTAFIKHLADAKAAADKKAEEAIANASSKQKAGGVDPVVGGHSSTSHLQGGEQSQESGEPVADYDAAVRREMTAGLSRLDARQQVERKNPRLVRDYLLATNPAKQHELIKEKFAGRVK